MSTERRIADRCLPLVDDRATYLAPEPKRVINPGRPLGVYGFSYITYRIPVYEVLGEEGISLTIEFVCSLRPLKRSVSR